MWDSWGADGKVAGESASIVDGLEAEKNISTIGASMGATARSSVDGTTWCTAPMRTETMEKIFITHVQGIGVRGWGYYDL